MKRRLPDIVYNPISIIGAALASVSFLTILFLTFVDLFQENPPAYIGIISYVVLPVPLVVGLLLIPLGIVREKRRIRRGLPASRMSFTVDLNVPRQRRAITLFSVATIVFLLFSAYGSYRTFEWTESVAFCGTTCHSVMEPEYTAYQHSPHAACKMRGLPRRIRSGVVCEIEIERCLPGVCGACECIPAPYCHTN